MAARSVQISLDERLLEEIDRRPETKREGRSAVIREALRSYLDRKQRESVDRAYAHGYGPRVAAARNEIDPLLDSQAWPDET
ncbi:MAG: CopG family ribbon-helix-helix protein [Polyangiales bacterium]